MESYERLLEARPYKFSSEEVGYREGDGEHQCKTCAHFFTRKIDGFHVCEVYRPSEEENESIIPNYVCSFWNDDTENYPLRDDT